MSTRSIQFYVKRRNVPYIFPNISFLELSEEFPTDSKTSSN